MTLQGAGPLALLLLSLLAAAFAGVRGVCAEDGTVSPRLRARVPAFFSLALLSLAAVLAGQGWLLPLAAALLALAALMATTAQKRPTRLGAAGAFALLGLSAQAALALGAGGGAGVLRSEPLRLAGLLAATSLAVLALRRGPLRAAAAGPQGAVAVCAVFCVAATALTLPVARIAAMAGGLVMVFALTPLSEGSRARLTAALTFYGGEALFVLGFIPLPLRPPPG